jgi:hypothetical protein
MLKLFEEFNQINENFNKNILIDYYNELCKLEKIDPLPIKFGRVGKLGAAIYYNSKTMLPLYIIFEINKVPDVEVALYHELAHQVCIIKYKEAGHGAKFKKEFNRINNKYMYSNLSMKYLLKLHENVKRFEIGSKLTDYEKRRIDWKRFYEEYSSNQFINENLNEQLFNIPKEIESFYNIKGDLTNINKWKAKIIVGNNIRGDKKIGDWDDIIYVLISLTSNFIIPVARADEHHIGYDLLLYLIKKYKIKNLNYQSISLVNNHFVYGGEYFNKEFNVIKKAYDYGIRNLIIKKMGKNLQMNIKDYIENNGDFNQAKEIGKKSKKLSYEGQKFINELSNIVKLLERYKRNPTQQKLKFDEIIIDSCKKLYKIIINNELWDFVKTDSLKKAIENENIDMLEKSLLSHNGIKNTMHILLKKNNKELELFFWSNENALEQFDAMSIF